MAEVAKAITDPVDGIMADNRFFSRDNDAKFSHGFDAILEDEGMEIIRIPFGIPNANAFLEWFVRTIKDECLNRTIFFGSDSLMRAQRRVLGHYHRERNHQDSATD